MNCQQATEYILSRRKFQKSASHCRIRALLELLGNPQQNLRFVHTTGTNGKGSFCTALSCILTESGYRTGLFTSPYVIKFNERIRLDGEMIPDEELAELTALIKEKTEQLEKEGLYPTVFELTTVLGLLYFERHKCDIVVLEAGIGGRNDSTNVIDNTLLSVFMSISLDHTEMLGETVQEIALEKSGILKKGCAALSYPDNKGAFGFIPQPEEAMQTIKEQCLRLGCSLTVPRTERLRLLSRNLELTRAEYDGISLEIHPCGEHQLANMITVVEAARLLRDKGFEISDESIERGISLFRIPGRAEFIDGEPAVLLDGGHNEGCMLALEKTLRDCFPDKKITVLAAFMKDKDYESSLAHIAPCCSSMVLTKIEAPRAQEPEALEKVCRKYCSDTLSEPCLTRALEKAAEKASGGVLVVCGSFYLVSEVRNKLLRR